MIVLGFVVLALIALQSWRAGRSWASTKNDRTWHLLTGLLLLFIAGYALTGAAIVLEGASASTLLVATVFLAAAAVVHATTRAVGAAVPRVVPKYTRDVPTYSGTFAMPSQADDDVAEPASATILIVDDSELSAAILEEHLRALGHRGLMVLDGESALTKLAGEDDIELVLLDYWLGEKEGITLLGRLKEDKRFRDIPVLMLSSERDGERIAQCIEAGADDFLPKPFEPRIFEARIEASLAKHRFRSRERQFMARLDSERKRSGELLQVILPAPIAHELSTTNQVAPRRYEHVAVLFADIAGFTAYCDKHEPEEVLAHLQSIVIAFEELAADYDVRKIKTIGDSFMAACGLLQEVPHPVLRCVAMGLEMKAIVDRVVPEWSVRVGVHVGTVVAGIVGRSQYLFDIWGDTVNTASRIESSATDAGVSVSRQAWQEIESFVDGGSQGMVHAKGKGDIEIFQVHALRPAAVPLVQKLVADGDPT